MNSFARKTIIVIVVMTVVALAGWAGRKAYLRETMHRLLTESAQFLDKRDLKQASLCLQQAISMNSANITANKLMADMLEEAGSPAALNWRIRTAQLQTNNVEYRFAWAQTAMKLNEFQSAAQALRGVDDKYKTTAEYHKLLGALAWNLHSPAEAQKEYAEALRLEPTNQIVALNLDTIGLVSTNAEVANSARSALEKIPKNSPLYLTATRFLITDAVSHKSFDRALFFSQEVVADPKATYADKLGHLEILDAAKSPQFDSWLASLETDASQAPQHAYILSRWMIKERTPEFAMKWLEALPTATRTNMPVPLAITDCQLAMKDWAGVLTTIRKQDWDEFNYYRLFLEALADRNSGEIAASKSAWRRTLLMSSSRLDRLTKLDQLTGLWGWTQERSEVLQELTGSFPKEVWASEELTRLYYTNGDTHALAALLDKLYAADPSNTGVENNLATVLMLLKSDSQKANRLALDSYTSSTNNPFFACTYAYSLLLQSKPEEAARVVSTLNGNYLKNPSIAAYYGVVEAETGHKEAAKAALNVAQSGRLLPEEMEMVRKAETRL